MNSKEKVIEKSFRWLNVHHTKHLGYIIILFLSSASLINYTPVFAQFGDAMYNFGVGYDPVPVTVPVLTYYNGLQNITVLQYNTNPDPNGTPVYAKILDIGQSSILDADYPRMHIMGGGWDPAPNIDPYAQVFVDFTNTNVFKGTSSVSTFSPYPTVLYSEVEAVSVFWAAQRFRQFTSTKFGWHGIDQTGMNEVYKLYLSKVHASSSYQYFNKKIILLGSDPNDYDPYFSPQVSLDVVGHEISHAILHSSRGVIIDHNNPVYENLAIQESFCDIMGVCLRRSIEAPLWTYGDKYAEPADPSYDMRNFESPNSLYHPDTYNGDFWQDPGDPDYDPHWNAEVINRWFYLLVNGSDGPQINDLGNIYQVLPLDPDPLDPDPLKAENLAAQIVFKAVTEHLTMATDFLMFRDQVLASIQPDWPIGSSPYQTIVDAFFAVGIGPPWSPTGFNPTPAGPRTALTLYNGNVEIGTTEVTLTPDPASPKMYLLERQPANDLPLITTKTSSSEIFLDADNNNVYDVNNSWFFSRSGVSIHWATEYTLSYFRQNGWSGLDGNGATGHPVISEVILNSSVNGFNPADEKFYYSKATINADPPHSSLDVVASEITKAIIHFRSGIANGTPEEMAIRQSLGNIFGVLIENSWHIGKGEPIRYTIGEEISVTGNPDYLQDLGNPTSKGQQNYYGGSNYDPAAAPFVNSGIMNKWFYLISHGGVATMPDGEEVGVIPLGVDPAGVDLATQLAIRLLKSPGLTSFYATRTKSLEIMTSLGYILGDAQYNAVMNAWYAVGIGESFESHFDIDPDDNASNVPMNDWLLKFRFIVDYPGYESNWRVQVSEDPSFPSNATAIITYASMSYDPAISAYRVTVNGVFDGDQTIYWRKIANVQMGDTKEDIKEVAGKKRHFTTESKKVDWTTPGQNQGPLPVSMHPWEFTETGDIESGAQYYYVPSTEDSQFNTIPQYLDINVPAPITGNPKNTINLKEDETYFYYFQAFGPTHDIDNTRAAFGIPSEEIRIKTSIPVCQADQPANGEKIPPYGIELSAKEVKGASLYICEISAHSDFSNSFTMESSDVLFELSKELQKLCLHDGDPIYVRYRPVGPELPAEVSIPNERKYKNTNKELGNFGDPVSYVIDHSQIHPKLWSPENGSYVEWNQYSNFAWYSVKDAASYSVEFFKNGNSFKHFSALYDPLPVPNTNKFYDDLNADGVTDDTGVTMSWQVTSIPQDDGSPCKLPEGKSPVWEYHVDADAPELIYPTINDSPVPTNVTFAWKTQIVPPNGNHVQYGTDPANFDNTGIDVGSGQTYIVNGLVPNTTYYWRAAAVRSDGGLVWSHTIQSFTTGSKADDGNTNPEPPPRDPNVPCELKVKVKWENCVYDDGDPNNNPGGALVDGSVAVGIDWSYDGATYYPMYMQGTNTPWVNPDKEGETDQIDTFQPTNGVVYLKARLDEYEGTLGYTPRISLLDYYTGNQVYSELIFFAGQSFSAVTFVCPTTGHKPERIGESNFIYPNPVDYTLHLTYQPKGEASIDVYDINGMKLISIPFSESIDVSGLRPGLYQLVISEEGHTYRVHFSRK